MEENPAYETKKLLQRNQAYENTPEPSYEIIPAISSQAAQMSIKQPT